MLRRVRLVVIVVSFVLCSVHAVLASVDRSIEIAQLAQGLASENQEIRINSVKYISKLNISEQVLNDRIAENLRIGSMVDGDSNHQEEMLHFCYVLTSSGGHMYNDLFKGIALMSPIIKLRECALDGIKVNEEGVVQTHDNEDVIGLEQKRLIEMLVSGSVVDIKRASRMITRMSFVHKDVYDTAEQTLRLMVDNFDSDHKYVDTISWLCKALGSSSGSNYKDALIYAIQTTGSSKVKKYAQLSLAEIPIGQGSENTTYKLISEDYNEKKYEIFNSVSGNRWIIYDSNRTGEYETCRAICKNESSIKGVSFKVPSSYDYNILYKRFKGTEVMRLLGIKNYTTSDEFHFLPITFSFASGMTEDNVFAGHVACISK